MSLETDVRYMSSKILSMEQIVSDLKDTNNLLVQMIKDAVQPTLEKVTRGQAAYILGIGERTVDKYCKEGKLRKDSKGMVYYSDVMLLKNNSKIQ